MMTVIIGAVRGVLCLIYAIFKLFPTKEKIVFLSRQANTVSVDFKLLGDNIKQNHPEYKTVFLCKKIGKGILGKISYAFHILLQMYHLATSKVAIVDSYCIPVSLLNHKKSLLVIQIWHALGNMKRFGYAMLDKPEGSSSKLAYAMRMHKNYDYLTISSMSFAKDFLEGFSAKAEQLVELPLPKTDLLTDKEYASQKRAEITAKYPKLSGKKNILYCPTFRKSDSHIKEAAENLLRFLNTQKYNLILSDHPVSSNQEADADGILRFAESTFELLFAADFVISDYSTVFYEAGLLGLPIFSYAFDWKEYSQKREINFDIEKEFPGLFTDDAEKIISDIENEIFDFERLNAFINKNVSVGNGNCTQRLTEFIFEKMK